VDEIKETQAVMSMPGSHCSISYPIISSNFSVPKLDSFFYERTVQSPIMSPMFYTSLVSLTGGFTMSAFTQFRGASPGSNPTDLSTPFNDSQLE
jgi:hypothetical protein